MHIRSSGAEIVSTDYWETPHAQAGLVYCSLNAGTVRVLVPAPLPDFLAALAGAERATVGLGALRVPGRCLITLYDAGPEQPYVFDIDARLCDRSVPQQDVGRRIPLVFLGPDATQPTGVTHLGSLTATITRAAR